MAWALRSEKSAPARSIWHKRRELVRCGGLSERDQYFDKPKLLAASSALDAKDLRWIFERMYRTVF